MRALVLAIAVLVSGCGSHLRPDPSPPSIDAGYPSAEIRACGQLWNGNAVCRVKPGDSLVFSVQGYYKGSITVTSSECGLNVRRRYDNHERASFSVPRPSGICVVAITVVPEYPPQKGQDIVVRGFRGYLAVVPAPGNWMGDTRKVTGNWRSSWKPKMPAKGDYRVVLEGCGRSYDQTLATDDSGRLSVPLHEAVDNTKAKPCLLTGVVISPRFKDLDFHVLVSVYGSGYSPLPIPVIEGKYVSGDPAVSAILYNGEKAKIGNEMKLDDEPKSLSLVTTQGRSVFGEYTSGGWRWKQ